jgi:uncharacterized protein (DUF1810 family)
MSPTTDPFNPSRFVTAQEPVYAAVLEELAAGQKRSHWMWFIFPQLKELGRSATARHFGIASKAEAQDYWMHALLGKRLKQCTEAMLKINGKTALQILGSPDDLKFKSCMTLFYKVTGEPIFEAALDKFFAGQADVVTVNLLR